MDTKEPIVKEHALWILITQIEHLLGQAFSRELKTLGLTREKWAVIHELAFLGKQTSPYTLAKRFVYEPHSISALICRMEREGLIIKEQNPEKKHMVRISLSEKALALYPRCIKICQELFAEAMGITTEEEKLTLLDSLGKLRDHSVGYVKKNKKLTPFKIK